MELAKIGAVVGRSAALFSGFVDHLVSNYILCSYIHRFLHGYLAHAWLLYAYVHVYVCVRESMCACVYVCVCA